VTCINFAAQKVDITGNFFGAPKGNANYQPPPELAEFLAKGEPPIFIGFGSMVIEDTAALVKTVCTLILIYSV
jgi:sterol 3beta-glucosyltransferase